VIAGWGGVLRVLEIVPGTGGVFDVHVDDELLFTKSMIGHYPEPEEVLPLLRERIGGELPGS
jgi:selenoprotein W-related protein